jgi:hypothetical protein
MATDKPIDRAKEIWEASQDNPETYVLWSYRWHYERHLWPKLNSSIGEGRAAIVAEPKAKRATAP